MGIFVPETSWWIGSLAADTSGHAGTGAGRVLGWLHHGGRAAMPVHFSLALTLRLLPCAWPCHRHAWASLQMARQQEMIKQVGWMEGWFPL